MKYYQVRYVQELQYREIVVPPELEDQIYTEDDHGPGSASRQMEIALASEPWLTRWDEIIGPYHHLRQDDGTWITGMRVDLPGPKGWDD